jgi:hypothetical protein
MTTKKPAPRPAYEPTIGELGGAIKHEKAWLKKVITRETGLTTSDLECCLDPLTRQEWAAIAPHFQKIRIKWEASAVTNESFIACDGNTLLMYGHCPNDIADIAEEFLRTELTAYLRQR